MKRFSLQSLLLLVALVCVSVGWYIEASRRPELIYLHVYSTYFSNNYVPYDSEWDRKEPKFRHNARIATVAIESGRPFDSCHGESHYDPQIDVEGFLTQRGNGCIGRFSLSINAPDLAYVHDQKQSVQMDRLYPLDTTGGTFHFAVSNSADPYSLDYKLQ